ncbi:cytochrome c-type biogenesis protein [Microbaculum marinum]|uniref:Cytochrome c-type biogenesis protein n=1 Tax=Microbaculum marinum TaxID=1764581 RepID=A0AAW9RSA5_9HYPH
MPHLTRPVLAVLAILVCLAGPPAPGALAVQPDEILDDPALEARARDISEGLRCLVCQNQSIDDSDAPLARDLRILVRERLEAGDSDGEVVDFIVARYGEFVLLRPTFAAHNLILWLTPVVLLLLGGIAVVIATRRRRGDPAKLSAEEEKRIAELLDARD